MTATQTVPTDCGPTPEPTRPSGAAEVADRFVSGDEDALAEVYREWGTLVQALARRALGDPCEAEDVTQTVFLAAWRGRGGFRPERGSLSSWLVGITRRKIADALAARTRRTELVATASSLLALDDGPPLTDPQTVLDRVVIGESMAELTEPQRRVLNLAYYEDLTQVQISQVTGWPLGTVKSHQRRALHRLSRCLQEDALVSCAA
ncbi:RNA polymerase sigma factor [Streptomyces sp. NPDC059688]|uniref:RNA polymerase sigma factor n=1 Tax=Streptomyces sp. NPDC059688 TaxID=3346906 RepID=UPI003674D1B4